jgi:hypothetical protein
MPVIIQCPRCPTQIQLRTGTTSAKCPRCQTRFSAGTTKETKSKLPPWISLWGLAAAMLATAGLLTASLVGERLLTLALAGLGVAAAAKGVADTGQNRQKKDRVWLQIGGSMSGLLLFVTIFYPGLINHYWAISAAVIQEQPDKQVAVPRDQPLDEGRLLFGEDCADAGTEVIRHQSLLLSVESVKAGPLPNKGKANYILVHCRLANVGAGMISFTGFDKGKHQPVLSDDVGRTYTFVEQRRRLPSREREPLFDAPATSGVELSARAYQDYLLVFEALGSGLKTLKLELPAAAWKQPGVCQFRIAGAFEANLASSK